MIAGSSNELTITAYDAYANINSSGVNNYTGAKSLTFSGLANAAAGNVPTVEGTNFGTATSITFTNGVSNVNGATLIAYKAESASVDVSDGSINSTGDSAYDLDLTVDPAAANNLAFLQQPSNAVAGASISPAVTVQVRDIYNNLKTNDSSTSVSITIGTNPGSGILSGAASTAVVNGIATFSGLSIDEAGAGYTLNADSGSLGGAVSNSFNITAAPVVVPSAVTAPSVISAESQLSNALILSIGPLPLTAGELTQYRINSFDPAGQVYFYHPLTNIFISVFNEYYKIRENDFRFTDPAQFTPLRKGFYYF